MCGLGSGAFGGALSHPHAASSNHHSRGMMKSPHRPEPVGTADDVCQEEEEVCSPVSNNGRLVVPFAGTTTSPDQDNNTDRAVLSVPSHSSNFLMTSSTTAILSSNNSAVAANHAESAAVSPSTAAGDPPLFGMTSSSSSVSPSHAPSVLMPGIQDNIQNDPRQANLQQQQQQEGVSKSPRGGRRNTKSTFRSSVLQVVGLAPKTTAVRRDRSDKSTKYYNDTAKTSVPTIAPKVTKASRPPSVVEASVPVAYSNSTRSNRHRATLDSTVAAATVGAAAAAATMAAAKADTTTTPRGGDCCNTSCSDVYTTTSSEAAGAADRQTPHTTMSSGWTSLIMGAQTYDSNCCGPPLEGGDDDGDQQNDDDDSKKRLLPNNDIDPSSSVATSPGGVGGRYHQAPTDITGMGQHSILDQNPSSNDDGDDDNNSDVSSFNDESSMMHGNEGDGTVDLAAFESSLARKKSSSRQRASNSAAGGTHSSTAGRSSSAMSEWAQYTRRRRMKWMVLVTIALMILVIMAIVLPRTVYGNRARDNVNSNNDNVQIPGLSSAPTVAPSTAVTKPDSLPTVNGGGGSANNTGTTPSEGTQGNDELPNGGTSDRDTNDGANTPTSAPAPTSSSVNDNEIITTSSPAASPVAGPVSTLR